LSVRPRRYQPIEAVTRHVLRGPHPVAVETSGGIDRAYGRAMAGDNGAIRIGEHYSRKYSGELGPLQNFKGAQTGKVASQLRTLRGGTALPGTNTLPNVNNPVMALLARTEGISR
jgi:hypothetical protein